MIEPCFCFIKEQYFIDNPNLINMLDPGNPDKQSKRTHLCVEININSNTIYLPLRNNLGASVRKFGKIGYPVPSNKRPNAGFDYRYSLIINDKKYIEFHTEQKLPNSQYNVIIHNYSTIKQELNEYVTKYVKAAKKNRHTIEPLFKLSSLINYHEELGIKINSCVEAISKST